VAADATGAIGARAFTSGESIAFARRPDLYTAAHEATHLVQQRAGIALPGGIGVRDDPWEQHADAVADAVTSGRSAERLLDAVPGVRAGGSLRPSFTMQLLTDGEKEALEAYIEEQQTQLEIAFIPRKEMTEKIAALGKEFDGKKGLQDAKKAALAWLQELKKADAAKKPKESPPDPVSPLSTLPPKETLPATSSKSEDTPKRNKKEKKSRDVTSEFVGITRPPIPSTGPSFSQVAQSAPVSQPIETVSAGPSEKAKDVKSAFFAWGPSKGHDGLSNTKAKGLTAADLDQFLTMVDNDKNRKGKYFYLCGDPSSPDHGGEMQLKLVHTTMMGGNNKKVTYHIGISQSVANELMDLRDDVARGEPK
jgi:hypothetical protein